MNCICLMTDFSLPPHLHPSTLTPAAQVLFKGEQNIPWGVNDCTRDCFAAEPAGTSVCYGLVGMDKRAVGQINDIAQDDPYDEVFYSTCYRKESNYEFDGPRRAAQSIYPPTPRRLEPRCRRPIPAACARQVRRRLHLVAHRRPQVEVRRPGPS